MHWYFPLFTLTFLSAVWLEVRYELMSRHAWFVPVLIAGWIAAYWIAQRFNRERLALCLLLGCCIGFAYTNLHIGFVHEPLEKLNGERSQIRAVVTGYADRYEDAQRVPCKVQVKASGLRLWMPSFYTMAYLPLTEEALVPGDRIQGVFSFYRGSSNGGFDRAAYYAGRNYHILASCEEEGSLSVQPPKTVPLSLRPVVWAHGFQGKLSAGLDARSASLMKGLLFGDKADFSISDRQNMQKAGLSHIVAVSGMHVGFLVGFFTLVFGRRVGLALALGALFVFVPMAGASASVIRAAIMYAFAAVGFYLRLEHSALHSLCAALVVLLLHNPFAIFSLSLQLSFLATLGLILFGTRLQNAMLHHLGDKLGTHRKKRAARMLAGTVSCSLGASALTTPVLLYTFGYVSAASVVANLLTVGVFSVMFVCGFLLCILGGVPVIGGVLLVVIKALCAYVFGVAELVGGWTFPLLYWEAWYTKAAMAGIYLVIAAALLLKRHLSFRRAVPLVLAILFAALWLNPHTIRREHRISLLASGSGQSIAVSHGRKSLVLIDCGASGYRNAAQNAEAYVDWYGFSQIDLLILTAVDQTHARNVPALLDRIPVGHILIPPETRDSALKTEVMDAAARKGIPVSVWSAEGERPVGDTRLGLSILGGGARKLGVRVAPAQGPDLLVLHSLTPKMAAALLDTQPVVCDTLVLSEQFLTEDASIGETLRALSPDQIYLQTAWYEVGRLEDIPVRTTKAEGTISLRSVTREVQDGGNTRRQWR